MGSKNFANKLQNIKEQVTSVKFSRNQKKLYSVISCVVAALVVVLIISSLSSSDIKHGAYSIFVNDKEVIATASQKLAQDSIDEYLKDLSDSVDANVSLRERVDVAKSTSDTLDVLTDKDAIKELLASKVTPITVGETIVIDGKDVLTLAGEDSGIRVLQRLKDQSIADYQHLEFSDIKFREDVSTERKLVNISEITSEADAKAYLLNAKNVEGITYTVQSGESMWAIAGKLGVSFYDLQAANSDINPNKLKPGQELVLQQEVPVITVVAVAEKTEESIIPYSVTYKTDRSMAAGTSTVSQQGQNGSELVDLQLVFTNGKETARTRLASTVLTEPVNKIVVSGPALTVASRSNVVSDGSLLWPTSAKRISSYFGKRSRGNHTGLDIDGDTGDDVWAAASGTVVFSGWSGGYGNLIKVDHGNGMQTWYAHLSKRIAAKGDVVNAGDVIGIMGSTGNSTGSHLHIEVRIGGKCYNPLAYLKK